MFLWLFYSCSDSNSVGSTAAENSAVINFDIDENVGSSAKDLLRADRFESLIVELDWIGNLQPTQQGMDSLKIFLEERLHKPGGIEIIFDDSIPSPGIDTYKVGDIRSLEEEHRDFFTTKEAVVVYMIALDGKSENENVLGIAYNNTSFALFQQEIINNSGGFFRPSRYIVEGAVSRHEFGHLMGLVNNGTPMIGEQGGINDHHDEENGAHCTVEESLMHFQIRTTNFGQTMMRESIPKLEPLDILDLQANGGK